MKERPTYKELLEQVTRLKKHVSHLEDRLKTNQEKTEKMKTRFLTTVSHELRTPMNAILGFSNLMVDTNLPYDKKEEYMEHINNSSNSLLNIVDSMIDVSLLEINELKLKKESFDLHEVLQQLYYHFNIEKHRMGKNHLALLLNIEDRENDFIIYSDPYRIKQVLSCFLHNALKFTSKGLIEFGYKLQPEEKKIHFFIKDSGKGVLYEKAQSIFDKFEKLDEFSGNERGVGLGLTLAKGIIKLMGGEVWLEANLFNGTTFHFTTDYLAQNIETERPWLKLNEILV